MNETLVLNDGTIIQNAETVQSVVVGLWIHINNGMTFDQVYNLFSDPDKTEVITSDKTTPMRPNGNTVYEGFSDLYMIKRENDGKIIIGLHHE